MYCNLIISKQAKDDLDALFLGLLVWEKWNFTPEKAIEYVDDIIKIGYSILDLEKHKETTYLQHKSFGTFVLPYKRNSKTTWYLIYNIVENSVVITKIISNYQTTE